MNYSCPELMLTVGAWAQGEENWRWKRQGVSALVRMSTDGEFREGDVVIMAASIPTWSPSLTAKIKIMARRIASRGARLIVDTSAPKSWERFAERREIHAGGHGNRPDIFRLVDRIKPRRVLPIHASPRARMIVAEYCRGKGIEVIEAAQGSRIKL